MVWLLVCVVVYYIIRAVLLFKFFPSFVSYFSLGLFSPLTRALAAPKNNKLVIFEFFLSRRVRIKDG